MHIREASTDDERWPGRQTRSRPQRSVKADDHAADPSLLVAACRRSR